MSNVAVVGGFTTGTKTLEPVVEAAVELGFADDGETIRLRDAMDRPEGLERFAKSSDIIITHSAGILAVDKAGIAPGNLAAFNGPEPRSIGGLAASASKKVIQLAGRVVAGPDSQSSTQVLTSNAAELALHPHGNIRHLPSISRFSTLRLLNCMRSSGSNVDYVTTEDDVFYPPLPSDGTDGDTPNMFSVSPVVYAGDHDELLINPAGMLDQLKQDQYQQSVARTIH